MNRSDVVDSLRSLPTAISDAIRHESAGGLPAAPGFYAWWTTPDSIPGVPPRPHPSDSQRHLFYVGISPARAASSGTIRSRVLGYHLRGNLGSSTFRLTLAALLAEELDLHASSTSTKVVLSKAENDKLSRWQRDYLALTWCVTPEPWTLEGDVIAAMGSPLNLAINPDNEFGRIVSSRRAAIRAAARSSRVTAPE
jgi:hypothetical protein